MKNYILFICLCLFEVDSFGHDQIVHQEITKNAEASAFAHSSAYGDFLNIISSDFSRLPQPFQRGAAQSMIDGSYDEDFAAAEDKVGGNRSYNHFYDPLDDTYGKGLTDVPNGRRSSTPVGKDSFAWASISNCVGVNYYGEFYTYAYQHNLNTSNIWSWPNARYYEWLGLTATNQIEKSNV